VLAADCIFILRQLGGSGPCKPISVAISALVSLSFSNLVALLSSGNEVDAITRI
jgi:hypothetical protein